MKKIIPVILAGGIGSRLWPLSRQSLPKQFSLPFDNMSLFQNTILRNISGDKISFDAPIVVTSSVFRFTVKQQLKDLGLEDARIIVEPDPKNTGPAILLASLVASEKDSNSILLVCPSDHMISQSIHYTEKITEGLSEIENDKFVLFGVRPDRPEEAWLFRTWTKKTVSML